MAANGPSLISASCANKKKPNSSSNDNVNDIDGKNNPKLLRRPRPPKQLPPIPTPSPVKDSDSPSKPFYHETNYEYDGEMTVTLPESTIRHSPTPSVVPSLISPPPSESNPTKKFYRHILHRSQPTNVTFQSSDEKKFVLDPLYRVKTSLGTYVDGKSLVKPFKPRGPDSFPGRPPRKNPEIFHVDYVEDERYFQPPAFTLDTFLMDIADRQKIPLNLIQKAVTSRFNYKRLLKLIDEQNTLFYQQDEMHVHTLTPEGQNIPPAEPRIPQKQLLIEMAAMIKQHVRDLMHTEVKSVIRPLKRYSPSYADGMDVPHTEIILYEEEIPEPASRSKTESQQQAAETEAPAVESIFHSSRSKYFQGSGRSQSPFMAPGEGAGGGTISPSELAILDALISGGRVLSLKAHFITTLPDITPLVKTITYLNLSFNNFSVFPREILEIKQLDTLKLRNNPLQDIPPDINCLRFLKTLVVSFCLLQTLPLGVFALPRLKHLDVSYNKITFLPNEVSHLRCLRELNLEGNQLPAMPCGALLLHLDYLNVKNNFMHPLFWNEHTQNQPQRLIDMAALNVYLTDQHTRPEKMPPSVQNILAGRSICDCCHGPLYGPGLRIIRPVSKLHGIINLPFIFRACSPNCLHIFKTSKETLSEILYGTSNE